MPDLRKWTEGLKGFFGKDSKQKLIMLLGIAGMLLILLSQIWGNKNETPAQPEQQSGAAAVYTSEQYIAQLEQKLCGMITKIDGVGNAQVMVTLANSGENIYVVQENRNLDKNVEPGGEGAESKINSKENIQQSYILVETGYGQKEPLVKTHLEPKIQGVVIVCDGADNILVRQSLVNVITTALNIPTTRVAVEKIAG